MDWSSATITKAGAARINECITDGEPLEIVAVRAGENLWSGALEDARTMPVWKQTGTILRTEITRTGRRIHIQLASAGLAAGYQLRQIGVFCRAKSGADLLLLAMQDADGIPIPSGTEMPHFVLTLRAVCQIDLAVALEIRQVALTGPVRGIVTPEMFGAVGDGETDDSDALADALAAAGEGGMVQLEPTAVYKLTETLHMLDRQTLEGNGATILWEAEPTYTDNTKTVIKSAPPILEAKGSLEAAEIPLLEAPRSVANPASTTDGKDNTGGFTYLKVGSDPGLETGDRIVLQAARPAMQPESGDYWCGTATGSGSQTWWAEVLVVNDIQHEKNTSVWTVRCIGTLTYPYYLPEPEAGVDIARALAEVRNEDTKALVGYYDKGEGVGTPLARAHSTIRKAHFLRDVTVRNLKVEANGKNHTGSTAVRGGWKTPGSGGNSMRMTLCEGGGFENVDIRLSDMGRGFILTNCWKTEYRNCRYEANYAMYAVLETHAINNAFTFFSCWSCAAVGCYSLRAGQSFDTSYVSGSDLIVACPSLYITVRDCTVEQAMNSAATNHSGVWGQVFDGCRFIDCARAVAIRAPMTRIRGCVFSGTGGGKADLTEAGHDVNHDMLHLAFTEPTVWGCSVEDCTFVGGIAIEIKPYARGAFNYVRGNYLTVTGEVPSADVDPDHADPDHPKGYMTTAETSAWPCPPERKALGIRISGNTFLGCSCALWIKTATLWHNDKTGAATDYARRDLGVDFTGNTLVCCGAHYYPVYIGQAANGVRISGNRFCDCVSLDPSYIAANGAGVTVSRLIYPSIYNVRLEVRDNTVERCGGGFRYLVTVPDSVPSWLGTDGRPELSFGGNRILADGGVPFHAANGTETKSVEQAQDGRDVVVRGMAGGSGGLVTGFRYSWSSGSFELLAEDDPLVSVDSSAVWHEGVSGTQDALLRTWLYLPAGKASSAKWRTAVFDYPMDEETFARLCACWDAGRDETGAAVTFASSVKLVEEAEDSDPDSGGSESASRVVTYAPPVNAGMTFIPFPGRPYIGSDPMYSANAATGVVTVNVPAASAPSARATLYAFPVIPTGMDTSPRRSFTVCTELKAAKVDENIRINLQGTWHPGLFAPQLLVTETSKTEPASGTGSIYVWRVRTTASGLLDLGKADSPWKDIHAKTLSLGSTQVTETQLQALLALLE